MPLFCEDCGASNRPNARFCMRCGRLLDTGSAGGAAPGSTPSAAPVRAETGKIGATSAPTIKVCPRCQTPNPFGARTCQKCGHAFASSTVRPGYWRRRLLWGGIALVALLLLLWGGASLFTRQAPPKSTDPVSPLQRAVHSTVQLLTPNDSEADHYSAGSGTIVSENGHILTNYHVIGDVKTRQLYNRDGLIFVAIPAAGTADPPDVQYRATLIDADPALDLALVQISALENGSALPGDLGLTPVPVADSDLMEIGDPITVLGYPGLGGETITLTRGTVAGFLEDWIKTDAEINYGNSGGAAVNEAGELIGVPSAGSTEDAGEDRLPGKIGLIRPVNLAKSLLEQTH